MTSKLTPSEELFTGITTTFQGIPASYRLPAATLVKEYNNTSGPRNFAKHILVLLYPELFGNDNLRKFYSYNGGGSRDKRQLEPTRTLHLQRYVTFFIQMLSQLLNGWSTV